MYLLDDHQVLYSLIFSLLFLASSCWHKTNAHHIHVSITTSTLIDFELQRKKRRYITSQVLKVGQGYRIVGSYPPRYLDFPTPLGAVGAATSASET